MDILYLVDRLEELVNEGWRIPLTSNVVIDNEEFLDIIDQMRISVPEEIKQAKRIQQERDRLLSQAKEEADRILVHAREQHQSLLTDHEVIKAAESERRAIIEEGHREIRAIRQDADAYVVDVLSQLENQLSNLLKTVQNGIAAMQDQLPESPAHQRAPAAPGSSSAAQDEPEADSKADPEAEPNEE